MKRHPSSLLPVLATLVVSATITPLRAAPLPPGMPLMTESSFLHPDESSLFSSAATVTPISVSGQRFKTALRVAVNRAANNYWDVQLQWRNDVPVKNGDVLLVTVPLRTEQADSETGEAAVNLGSGYKAGAWRSYINKSISPARQWTEINVPFVVSDDISVKAGQFMLSFGFMHQTVDVGPLRVVDFGPNVDVKDLPHTTSTYDGEAPDAKWRAAAAVRIDQYRKSDLTVHVVDADNKPVAGAAVQVRMTRQAFNIGTCVRPGYLLDESADAQKYRDMLQSHYNTAVFEGELKWPEWDFVNKPDQRDAGRARLMQAYDWLNAHQIALRGHNLVWPGNVQTRFMPPDVYKLIAAGNKDAVRQRIADHIAEEVGAWRGKLLEWDVLNEPWRHHTLQDFLGRGAMVDWFKEAHAADPNVPLYLNDFCMLSGGATDAGRINAFFDNIKFLKDGGAPIGGIGEQAHFNATLTSIDHMLSLLDRFGSFGLPIRITEFDIDCGDDDLQANYLRDFYTAAFSHPAVNGILMWGFWEGKDWKPGAALWRKNWSPKPAALVFEDLVLKQWRTNADGKTSDAGDYAVRAFRGDYRISVAVDGKTVEADATADHEGKTVTLQLR